MHDRSWRRNEGKSPRRRNTIDRGMGDTPSRGQESVGRVDALQEHAIHSETTIHRAARKNRAISDYVTAWNSDAKPFTWTATPSEILAKVRWVHTEIRKLLANNDK